MVAIFDQIAKRPGIAAYIFSGPGGEGELTKGQNKTNKQTNNVETGSGRTGLYAPKN